MTWRLAQSLVTLRDEVQRRHPGTTVWTVADIHHPTSSDHHPENPKHPGVVTAIDVVGRTVASELAEHLRMSRDHRIKYVIHDIVNTGTFDMFSSYGPVRGYSAWEWRPYNGSNPHYNHMHLSVLDDRPHYDDPTPWGYYILPTERYAMLVYCPGKPDAEAVGWAEEYVNAVPGVVTRSESEAKAAIERKDTVITVGTSLSGADKVVRGANRIDTAKAVFDLAAKGWKV